MKEPWAVAPNGDVLPVPPEQWLFPPGAWDEVEAALGTPLPSDYKRLIGDGLACAFDEELWIASPFDPNPHLNLIQQVARSGWALAYLRAADPDEYSVAIYPEASGLLGFGSDGGGADYYWDTSSGDPDRWSVAVGGRPVFDPSIQRHQRTLTGYLSGLASGEIIAAALGDWPGPNARIDQRRP